MNYWKIRSIYAGQITIPKNVLVGGNVDVDLLIDIPFACFLLRNGKENVLVDTGMKDGYTELMQIGDVNPKGNTQMLLDGLKEEGLTPADIDTVIYTHLHYDHAGNGALFKHATTYVQKAEYNNLLSPYGFQQARADYFADTPEWITKLNKLILVDGSAKLSNGLELYLTKGHSLGCQTIVVPTEKGRYVMTGDIPPAKACLFPKMDKMTLMDGLEIDITPVPNEKFLMGGFNNDYFSAYDSHYLQLTLAEGQEPEYFIPSHEPGNIYRKYWG